MRGIVYEILMYDIFLLMYYFLFGVNICKFYFNLGNRKYSGFGYNEMFGILFYFSL